MSQFSHQMLDKVQSKDMGPVGDSLSHLMGKLKSVNPNDLDPNKQSKLKRILEEQKLQLMKSFQECNQ